MSQTEKERTVRARVERIRARVKEQQRQDEQPDPVWPVILGLLDLLEDRL